MGPMRSYAYLTFCRRAMLMACAVLVACGAVVSAPAQAAARFDISETTIAETQRAIAEHRTSCHQVIGQYLERIAAYDQSTHLNSLVVVNSNAMAEADRFDAEFKLTQTIHGLQCIGVIVKDNYDSKDLQTSGGSLAMKWFVPATDAFMVRRIPEAAPIIFSKFKSPEFPSTPHSHLRSIPCHT